jgi:hypothetical protein
MSKMNVNTIAGLPSDAQINRASYIAIIPPEPPYLDDAYFAVFAAGPTVWESPDPGPVDRSDTLHALMVGLETADKIDRLRQTVARLRPDMQGKSGGEMLPPPA